MKRFKSVFALVLVVALAALACACESTAPSLSLDSPVPWTHSGDAKDAYEKCVYSIERKDVTTDKVTATGTLTYELAPSDDGKSVLTSNMSITYTDDAPERDRGKTDTVTSSVKFSAISLAPESSVKTVELAVRDGETANLSYDLAVDYVKGESTLTYTRRENAVSTISVGDHTLMNVYDNETLYYVARAASGIKAGGSGSFANACFFDLHGAGSFSYKTMNFTCASEAESLGTYEFLKPFTTDGSVSAIKTSLSQSGDNSGPAIDLWLSATDFVIDAAKGAKTRKVMMKLALTEYDVAQAVKKYVTTYSLSDYSVTKP